ncbi:MAG: DEAD/DEAH box helicase family protein [Actinobacteria bacterium]|jgi:superfamily II DNA or RNA helicase|nr:DEAD/DEAH box helicase family protein [Actinomycetota bacterium]
MDVHAERLSRLAFVHPWRTYQRLMLSRIEQLVTARYHLVSPPGSGKTIVGLEMVRRGGGPAVVFAPTTTIAAQWVDKVSLFTDDPDLARQTCSTDPATLSTINVFTYQRIATQAAVDDRLEAQALRAWREQLVVDGQVADEVAADARIEQMRAANPDRHRRQLRRRSRNLRRRLIDQGGDVRAVLHDNALALVDDLVALGVRTVVLDECHHLLDHWALVVRALLDRLPDATVVGLTATPPDPDDAVSFANYDALLGEVDFEVPTPAVVREGDLAPWRDLVYFVAPTPPERRLLRRMDDAFAAAVTPVLDEVRLHDWAAQACFGGDDPTGRLADHLLASPTLGTAQARLVRSDGRWPPGVPVPHEAAEPVTFDDRLVLVERFALDVLALSDDPGDHARVADLRRALRGFGLSLTERGLRQGRSAVPAADGALADDAGSASRAFHALIDDPDTEALDPMLVTGTSVLVDADHGDDLLAAFNAQLELDGIRARCSYQPTGHPQVLEIVGSGAGWLPATYVRLVTEVFESGATRCLVGTRGLFGEGWDSLALNTLIDLTAVTTSTGVQQLRGRSIRLDPAWPDKVAHNWDVVCVAADHPRGDGDLSRLVRRHQRTWGVTPPVGLTDRLRTSPRPLVFGEAAARSADRGVSRPGQIVRGVGHVSTLLAWQLAAYPLAAIDFEAHTSVSLRAIGDRPGSYELWDIGGDYDNFVTHATVIDVTDARIRTVHTVRDTLRALFARVGAAVLSGAAVGVGGAARTGAAEAGWGVLLAVGAVGALIGVLALLLVNRRDVLVLWRALFVDQPPDAILRDVGRAVLVGLRDAGLVSMHLQSEWIRVVAHDDDRLEVTLDYASEDDAATFVTAFRQVFAPVVDQRYLVRRTDDRLPSLPLTMLWRPIRAVVRARIGRDSHHPLPDVLAVNRARADAFAAAWHRYVGGGELLYTRTPEGRRAMLEARAGTPRTARSLAFDRWR